jgi:hypothetical protein
MDGNGHKLSNLQMSGGDWLGLFGQLDSNGQMMELGLENASLTGNDYVGGLVGCNLGRISACYSTGSIGGKEWVGVSRIAIPAVTLKAVFTSAALWA